MIPSISSSVERPSSSGSAFAPVLRESNNLSSITLSSGFSFGLPSQSSPCGSTFEQTQPAFGCNLGGYSFGTCQPAFDSIEAPTPGSFRFGTTPFHFGSQNTVFGAEAQSPTYESRGFGCGLADFGGRRRVHAYTPTSEVAFSSYIPSSGNLISISAMPIFQDKSHEEFRGEDYQMGDKACGQSSSSQSGFVFGQTDNASSNANSCGTSAVGPTHGQSSPFGKLQETQPTLGSSQSCPYTISCPSSQPIGAKSIPASGSSSTTSCGASSTRTFSYRSTPAFASSSATGLGASSTPSVIYLSAPALGSSSPNGFSAFSTPSTPFSATGFGASSTPSFSSFSAPSPVSSSPTGFGASSTPTFGSFIFGKKDASGFFGSTQHESSVFGKTSEQAQPAFGQNPFSYTPRGASSQPLFRVTNNGFVPSSTPWSPSSQPVFGVTNNGFVPSSTPRDASSQPVFGVTNNGFVPSSTPWSASSQPVFGVTNNGFVPPSTPRGASSQPLFSATSKSFGPPTPWSTSSQPAFGATNNAFGSSSTPWAASSQPAFGAQRNAIGPSSAPCFGSIPAFGELDSGLGTRTFDGFSFLEKTEQSEASTSQGKKKSEKEKLRKKIEMELEAEQRVSQRHIDFLTSILGKLDSE